MAYFQAPNGLWTINMKVNPMLANLPLNFNGDLAKPGLTSLVISTNGHHMGFVQICDVWFYHATSRQG